MKKCRDVELCKRLKRGGGKCCLLKFYREHFSSKAVQGFRYFLPLGYSRLFFTCRILVYQFLIYPCYAFHRRIVEYPLVVLQ